MSWAVEIWAIMCINYFVLVFSRVFFFICICICVCICIRVFGQERILLRRVGGMVGMGAVMTCGPAHDLHPSQCARVQPLFHICAHSLNVFLRPCNCICQGSTSSMYLGSNIFRVFIMYYLSNPVVPQVNLYFFSITGITEVYFIDLKHKKPLPK